jgi:hypothetical protein
MQTITTIGLDIAKSVFQVHGVDATGRVVIRRQLKRRHVLAFFEKLPPCLVGIEACPSSHGGRWMDNVFIERLWRSLKHEDIYLKGYADGGEARAGIAAWMEFYNHRRLHQALGYQTPMTVWRDVMAKAKAVDMMDNADALTTCPQPKQQTQLLAAC